MDTILHLIVYATLASNSCMPASEVEKIHVKKISEQVFLAYTENSVQEYKVSDPRGCEEKIYVLIEATGKDAGFGAYWTVIIDNQTKSLSIRPGE